MSADVAAAAAAAAAAATANRSANHQQTTRDGSVPQLGMALSYSLASTLVCQAVIAQVPASPPVVEHPHPESLPVASALSHLSLSRGGCCSSRISRSA